MNDIAGTLDSFTERIKALIRNITKNAYEIGVALNKVKKTDAWKVRHQSFEGWVIGELGLSIPTANSLAKVARNLTKEEYLRFVSLGQTKLHLLSSAPAEDREEIASKASGLSSEALTKIIRKTRAGRGERIRKEDRPLTKADFIREFVEWVASIPCRLGNKCVLNESPNTGESCMIHAARSVLEGKRLPQKMLRRIR